MHVQSYQKRDLQWSTSSGDCLRGRAQGAEKGAPWCPFGTAAEKLEVERKIRMSVLRAWQKTPMEAHLQLRRNAGTQTPKRVPDQRRSMQKIDPVQPACPPAGSGLSARRRLFYKTTYPGGPDGVSPAVRVREHGVEGAQGEKNDAEANTDVAARREKRRGECLTTKTEVQSARPARHLPSNPARGDEPHVLRVALANHVATLHAKIGTGALDLTLPGHASGGSCERHWERQCERMCLVDAAA